jgi:G3E family GTPase
MRNRPLLFFVGGFLGAGKTTAIRALARIFTERGHTVAAITNDQAAELVDTVFLSGSGIAAREVAGSCFCCNFTGLADAIAASIESENADIILAEPVGSCTDIVATVVRPMRALMGDRVTVAAYSVLVEPKRWHELAGDGADAPWSMKYLFDRQLEEADCILVTKVDTLTDAELQTIMEQVGLRYPSQTILHASALKKMGLDKWIDFAQATPPQERWLQDIDYDRYAVAEAEMGWLNARVSTRHFEAVDGMATARAFLEKLIDGVEQQNGRIGHLKILAAAENGMVKAGTTQVGARFDVDGQFSGPVEELEFTINIRATLEPQDLSGIVQAAVNGAFAADKAKASILYLSTFRPAPPNPTYRFIQGG